MILGVIFDLGGTLITQGDFEEPNARGLLRWLRESGHAVPDSFVDALKAKRRALWDGRKGAEEVTAGQAIGAVLASYNLPITSPLLVDAERAFFTFELESVRPLPGAVEVLRQLHGSGLRIALISNASSDYFVHDCCRRLRFAPYLEPIVSSAAVGWVKPDRRIFQAVLDRWRVPPEAVVMIGDNLEADIAGAQIADMRSILVTMIHSPNAPTSSESLRPTAVAGALGRVGEIIEHWRVTP
ncbi:MAG: HAD family hydrolase [bacterium]